jgi:hypothetical protein
LISLLSFLESRLKIDQTPENVMGGAHSMHRSDEKLNTNCFQKIRRDDNALEYTQYLKKREIKCEDMDWINLEQHRIH